MSTHRFTVEIELDDEAAAAHDHPSEWTFADLWDAWSESGIVTAVGITDYSEVLSDVEQVERDRAEREERRGRTGP